MRRIQKQIQTITNMNCATPYTHTDAIPSVPQFLQSVEKCQEVVGNWWFSQGCQ